MIEIGCLARFFNRYENEVRFAQENSFSFMQLWYDNRGLCLHEDDKNPVDVINGHAFPTIVHAVLNVDELEEHIPKLLVILKELRHKELIIHPICGNRPIDETMLCELNEKVKLAVDVLGSEGITLYLENNSKIDPIFTEPYEIEWIFTNNPGLGFLLDIAHIDSLNHLKEIVQVKSPDMLHVADKHFSVVHEHLPVGHGEIDFNYIFSNIIQDYKGKIILEIVNTDFDIVNSREAILCLLDGNHRKVDVT